MTLRRNLRQQTPGFRVGLLQTRRYIRVQRRERPRPREKKVNRLCCLLVAVLLWPLAAWSQDALTVAGTVKTTGGTAHIERQGQRLVASVGMAVMRNDRIVTGNPGSLGLTLVDDTLLTLDADSQLELSEVRFDSTTNEGRLWLRLIKGAVHVVTGLIARESPKNIRIETPTAVMGVRGTAFIVETGSRP